MVSLETGCCCHPQQWPAFRIHLQFLHQLTSLTNQALHENSSFLSTWVKVDNVQWSLICTSWGGENLSQPFIIWYNGPTFSISKVNSFAFANSWSPSSHQSCFHNETRNTSKCSALFHTVAGLVFQPIYGILKIHAVPYPVYPSHIWFTVNILLERWRGIRQ